MDRWFLLFALLLAACAAPERLPPPASAAGGYRLDYSGVYGTGRVDLLLSDGHIASLGPYVDGIIYRGSYRRGAQGRLNLDLVAHLPPARQMVQGVAVVSTARDVTVSFEIPDDMSPGARWPVRIDTDMGPVFAAVTRSKP